MKNLTSLLIALRWNFLKVWVFFFLLSLLWKTNYTITQLAIITGAWSFAIILTSVVLIKIKEKYGK